MEREQKFCQSCGMPLADNNDFGTNADGGLTKSTITSHEFQDVMYAGLAPVKKIIADMADSLPTTYISSIDEEGYPCTKAMLSPRKREGIKVFYFTANAFSVRVAHYRANPKASIYLCDEKNFRAIMLKGTMEVLTDQDSKNMIWREGDTQYYPGGVTDPNYCVLKFTASEGLETYKTFYKQGLVEFTKMMSHAKPRFHFNTIGLFTTDNAKMVAFYHDIFGFHTEWNGIDPNVEMTLGGSRIIMFPRDAFEQMTSQQYVYPKGTNGTMEISFDVPCFADVDKEYERAVSMGAKPIFAPTTEPWGQRTCYVADPEGNLIEISSFIEG